MKKWVGVCVAVIMAAALAACDPNQDSGNHNTQRRDWAQGAQPQHQAPGQQPAPVQGDPSAHNDQPGLVNLFVEWTSENKHTPACEWAKNGASQPCANIATPHKEGVTYYGEWETEQPGKAGETFTVNAQGTGAIKSIQCTISWKGKLHPGVSSGTRCGASFTLD